MQSKSSVTKTKLALAIATLLAVGIALWCVLAPPSAPTPFNYLDNLIGIRHAAWSRELRTRDPVDDASKAWNSGDKRFKGVFGYGLTAPGLPFDGWYYKETYGVQGILGTSDCFTNSAQREFQSVASNYAHLYNGEILKRVQGVPSTRALQAQALLEAHGGHFAVVNGEIAAASTTLRALRDAKLKQALISLGKIDLLRIVADIPAVDSDLDLVSDVTHLTQLDISDSPISNAGLERISDLTRLTVLMLSRTKIDDAGVAKLKGLEHLQVLYLHDTKVTDAGMDSIQSLAELDTLYLGMTGVTDDGLRYVGQLKNLRDLTLSEAITNNGLKHLTGLTQLRFLGTRFTKVTSDGRAELRRALPSIQVAD